MVNQKPAPIPAQILYGPAKIALEAMLFLRIASPSLLEWRPSENLSQDAEMLLDACKTLRSRGSQEPYLENDLHLHGLIDFLSWPYDSEVKGILQDRYRSIMCGMDSSNFDFLLVRN
ncbi:unnamed protein product [Penicillium roqueforti FM164]|uniref:Genomic scaffold, ProqFM164S01 n=1 Tax=Penicillium roqueforti (strain FM164) TaxID=1365484 RepID=W6PUL9_PENRF|nr:unnamed protein product [Penicillium roqueforti FM164]